MFKKYKRLFIFDTETRGLSPDNAEILELGGLLLEKQENGIFEVIASSALKSKYSHRRTPA